MTDLELREIKISIMNDLFAVIGNRMSDIPEVNEILESDIADILMSCTIMFARDIITKMVFGMGKETHADEILKVFIDSTKEAVVDSFLRQKVLLDNAADEAQQQVH